MSAGKKLYEHLHHKTVASPPPGGGGSGTPPRVRTHFNSLPIGSGIDSLWAGKQCGGSATIEMVEDPAALKGHVQRHIVHSGDVLYGGDRCEVLTTQIGGAEGLRFQMRFGLYLPSNFYSDSSGWNYLCQWHYPNNGPAQVPMAVYIANSNQLSIRVLGGPVNSDGTMGTIRHEAVVASLTKGVWNDIGFDILQHATSGLMDCWVNGVKKTTWGVIPTISPGVPNTTYYKQGFYRAQNSPSGTQTYYFTDTCEWRESSPDAMLGWTP